MVKDRAYFFIPKDDLSHREGRGKFQKQYHLTQNLKTDFSPSF